MKYEKYMKIVITNKYKYEKNKNNILYILKTELYPGKVYKLRTLLLLCTCYIFNDNYTPIVYLCILVDNNIKRELQLRNSFSPYLKLIRHKQNEINYSYIHDTVHI